MKYKNLINDYKGTKLAIQEAKIVEQEIAKQYFELMISKFEKEVAPTLKNMLIACRELWEDTHYHERTYGYKFEDPSFVTYNEHLMRSYPCEYQKVKINISDYRDDCTICFWDLGYVHLDLENGNLDCENLRPKLPEYYQERANKLRDVIEDFPKFEAAFYEKVLCKQLEEEVLSLDNYYERINKMKSEMLEMITEEDIFEYLLQHEDKMLHSVNGELKIGNLKGGE